MRRETWIEETNRLRTNKKHTTVKVLRKDPTTSPNEVMRHYETNGSVLGGKLVKSREPDNYNNNDDNNTQRVYPLPTQVPFLT